jgi:chaperonin GroES
MTFPVKPLYDQVFVKKSDASRTKSGLHLTESVKGRAVTGIVVAAGPGLLSPYTGGYLPMTVKEGDRVFIKEFTGYIIKYEEEEVHVFKENEIIGVIPNRE